MNKTEQFYAAENPVNFEQKCPVVFILDTSGSMIDKPIKELNSGLLIFNAEIKKDAVASSRLDVAILTFNSTTKVDRDFALLDDSPLPVLSALGSTKLVDGCREAFRMLEARKQWYKSTGQTYYRPYAVLMTDGEPDSDQDVVGLAKEIRSLAEGEHLNFWPIAVNGADTEMLNKIAVPGIGASLPVLQLEGLEYVKLFKWLSDSFTKISKSDDKQKLDLTPTKEDNAFQLTTYNGK